MKFLRIASLIFLFFLFYNCSTDNNQNLNEKIIKLDYKIKVLEKSYETNEANQNETKAYIKFQYPIFSHNEYSTNTLNEKMLEIIKSSLDNSQIPLSFDEIINKYDEEYKNFEKEFPDAPGGWVNENVIDILYDSLNIVGLSYSNYIFEGGAHPNSKVLFFNYNLSSQNLIELDELFTNDFIKELTDISEKVFRKTLQLSAEADLTEEGYFFENSVFKLNKNFLITELGLKFLFNTYEIAPYVFGETEILIEYSSIAHLFSNNSILKKIYQNNAE